MKNSRVYVSKNGGANLTLSKDDLTRQVNKIILDAHGGSIIFVISALAGITRLLDAIFLEMQKKNNRGAENLFSAFTEMHLNVVRSLLSDNSRIFPQLEKYFAEIWAFIHKKSISNNPTMDQANLLKYGELCSSLIFSKFISSMKVCGNCLLLDARNLIISNSHSYTEGKVELNATVENIKFSAKKSRIIVTQGFIARDADGCDTVLGYDGSDLTAAVIAYSLLKFGKKVNLTYWKDIPGVFKNLNDKSDGIFIIMKIPDYVEFAKHQTVPVRADAIGLLSGSDSQLSISINSFKDLDGPGTIIRP